jgi:hypothetical protein
MLWLIVGGANQGKSELLRTHVAAAGAYEIDAGQDSGLLFIILIASWLRHHSISFLIQKMNLSRRKMPFQCMGIMQAAVLS